MFINTVINAMIQRIDLIDRLIVCTQHPQPDPGDQKKQQCGKTDSNPDQEVSAFVLPQIGKSCFGYGFHASVTTLPSSIIRIWSAIWAMVSS